MSRAPFKIFVGWDSRQEIAYKVCVYSLWRHSSVPLEIIPIKQQTLRGEGLYRRAIDPLASTEFTYTRFFVPYLSGFKGLALFVDCDFLFTQDIGQLFSLYDPQYAALCVQHDYRPKEETKMDGRIQTVYPRKNWSSLILWNCGHSKNSLLTPELINRETGAFLHRFEWLKDSEIGALPKTWNWLEGWDSRPSQGLPFGIHYTRGGPWFENCQSVDYRDLWLDEKVLFQKESAGSLGTISAKK